MTSIGLADAVRFQDLGLREEILKAVEEAGYREPTPIQARAVPEVLRGRDVVGIAQTGTGKTASFVLPILHLLAQGRSRARMPRALILSPTRELASQTAANFDAYGKYLRITKALLIGGVGMGEQERLLERGVDVLIATPGRLLDWFERGRVLLGGVEILVIDEADRMLDMGFLPDVERIVGLLIRRRQTLLFSATMPKEVRRLADTFLRDAAEIRVAPKVQKAELVEDVLVPTRGRDKRALLLRLLREQEVGCAMIFCNTKREVAALTRFLRDRGVDARDIHGDLDQSVRQATLDAFKKGEVRYLVATDVAARGLDIAELPVVINFDVPHNTDDYVHRIGRTGRAGRKGRAFTLVAPQDERLVQAIERLSGGRLPRLELEDPEEGRRAPSDAPDRNQQHAQAVEAPDGERASGTRRRSGRRAKTAASRSASAAPKAQPVVGLGDHVPRFLQIQVPVRAAAKSGAE